MISFPKKDSSPTINAISSIGSSANLTASLTSCSKILFPATLINGFAVVNV